MLGLNEANEGADDQEKIPYTVYTGDEINGWQCTVESRGA